MKFPVEESGKNCKMSPLWHGQLRPLSSHDPALQDTYYLQANSHHLMTNLCFQKNSYPATGLWRNERIKLAGTEGLHDIHMH